MKKLIYIFWTALMITSCYAFKSGLTISAKQTFILGEFNNKNYSAELINRSELSIGFKTVDKKSWSVTQSFELEPKGKTKVFINKDEVAYFTNENEAAVKIDVILSKGVQGMRYVFNK